MKSFNKLYKNWRSLKLASENFIRSYGATTTLQQQQTSNIFTEEFMLSDQTRKRLLDCVNKPLDAGLRLRNIEVEKRKAAVLIALCVTQSQNNNAISVLYTRRSVEISRHARQVSFPGGIQDSSDVDIIDCALRETEEEIGLPRERIEIWGHGSATAIPMTASITPVFGVIRNFDINELNLNQDEVEEAFTIPVNILASPAAVRYTQFKSGYSSPVFVAGHNKLWGITAYLTHNFLKCLLPSDMYNKSSAFKYVTPHATQKQRF